MREIFALTIAIVSILVISGCVSEEEKIIKAKFEQCSSDLQSIPEKFSSCAHCIEDFESGEFVRIEKSCVLSIANQPDDCKLYSEFDLYGQSEVGKCLNNLALKFNDTKFCDELDYKDG